MELNSCVDEKSSHWAEEKIRDIHYVIWMTRGCKDGKEYGKPTWHLRLSRPDNTTIIAAHDDLSLFEYNILLRLFNWRKYVRFKFSVKLFFGLLKTEYL